MTLIAIIDDDERFIIQYSERLIENGYEVLTFSRADKASKHFRNNEIEIIPDLILLDIYFDEEGGDIGYDLCAEIKMQYKNLPIIFLTASDDDFDERRGWEVGCDDFVRKGLPWELVRPRIEILLRKKKYIDSLTSKGKPKLTVVGNLTVKLDKLQITWNGTIIGLTLTQYLITLDLVNNEGNPRTLEQLKKAAKLYVEDSTITSHIRSIRRRFEEVDDDFSAIIAVRSKGYRWLGY